MNLFKLIEHTDESLVYEYQPEGKGKPGLIEYKYKQGDEYPTIKLLAEEDGNNGYYGDRARSYIKRKYISMDNPPEKATQMWY